VPTGTQAAAKAAVSAMIRARDLGPQRDFISELNVIAASEADRGDVAPVAEVHSDESHHHGQPLSGDDYSISFDSDGYPLLPECLNRRALLMICYCRF